VVDRASGAVGWRYRGSESTAFNVVAPRGQASGGAPPVHGARLSPALFGAQAGTMVDLYLSTQL
jgi:hypothetical protein